MNFENPENLKEFIEKKTEELKHKNKDKITDLKEKINALIN